VEILPLFSSAISLGSRSRDGLHKEPDELSKVGTGPRAQIGCGLVPARARDRYPSDRHGFLAATGNVSTVSAALVP